MSNRLLDMMNTEYPGYHPLMSICRMAHQMEADLRLQFDCHKEIAKYVEAAQKSVEFKGSDGSELIYLNLKIDDGEWD